MMTLDFQNCFIFVVLALFSLLCYFFIFKRPEDGYGLPPSPPALPIIGHLHLLLSTLNHKTLQKVSKKYGSILHLRIFNLPIVLISSASSTYEIFKAQDVNVSTRAIPPYEGSIFFGTLGFLAAPYKDYFKFMKMLIITKILGPHALERSRGIRAHEFEMFYSILLGKAIKKENVAIAEEAIELTNNIFFKMVMGRSFSEETREAKRVRRVVTEANAVLNKLFLAAILHRPLAKFGISLFKKELTGISRKFDEVLEKILVDYEEKWDEHQKDTYMMGVLLEASQDENPKYKITRSHIKSLLVELFIAASTGSSHVIEWTMAEIINNPNVFTKLREEIDSVVGKTRMIQEADLPDLPYLQAIVKEGLRLHPPGPVVSRMFQEACKIESFHIPEKTFLLINIYDIMRDPDSWEDPNSFKPERFLSFSRLDQEKIKTSEEALKYLPFGFGRRGCPGSNLAYLFVGITIGVMVQGFDWQIKGDMVNMEEDPGTQTLKMAYPLNCTPVPRAPNLFTSCV